MEKDIRMNLSLLATMGGGGGRAARKPVLELCGPWEGGFKTAWGGERARELRRTGMKLFQKFQKQQLMKSFWFHKCFIIVLARVPKSPNTHFGKEKRRRCWFSIDLVRK